MSTLITHTADDLSDLSVSDDSNAIGHDSVSTPFSDLSIHDQDGDAVIFSGGAEGLEGDADASNLTALLNSDRASVYVHGLEMGVDSGDANPSSLVGNNLVASTNATEGGVFSDILANFASTGGGVVELYQTNLTTVASQDWNLSWGSYDWQGELEAYDWVPAEATLNLNWTDGFDTQDLQDGLALAAAAEALGIKSAFPIISPQGLSDGDFATLASDANERTIAKDLGGLVIDMPSNLFLDNPGGDYQSVAISEINWAISNHLVVSVLLSPYSETTTGIPQFGYDSTFLSASEKVYSILKAAGALPTQWMVENYAPLDGAVNVVTGTDPNSINNVATWFADNALTSAEPDWFVGETSQSSAQPQLTATIALSNGLSLSSTSAETWKLIAPNTYEIKDTAAAVQLDLQSISLLTAALGTSTGDVTLTIDDGTRSVTSTTEVTNAVVQTPSVATSSLVTSNPAPTISGLGEQGSTITISIGSTVLGTALVSSDGSWTLTSSKALSAGIHDVSVTASDADGDVSATASAAMLIEPATSVVDSADLSAALTEVLNTVEAAGGSLSLSGNNYVGSCIGSFTSGGADVTTSSNSMTTLSSGNSVFIASDDLGTATLTNDSASSNVMVGDGTALSYSGNSSALILSGDQNDTVLAGAGNDTIDLGAGSNDIVLGAGNSIIYSEGTDSIVAGSGVDTIDLLGDSSTVFGGYGSSGYTGTSLLVDDTHGSGSLVFTATKGAVVDGSNVSFTTVVAFGNTTINGGAVGDHLYAGNGAEIALVGSASNNVLVANDGQWANGNFVDLDGSGATGGNQFWAGSGNATLLGGAGQDTLVAGTGSVTMSGGTGASNYFGFFSDESGGNATITDFSAVRGNELVLFGYGAAGVETAIESARQVGSSTVLSLGDGTTITLQEFMRSSLVASDFGSTT